MQMEGAYCAKLVFSEAAQQYTQLADKGECCGGAAAVGGWRLKNQSPV